MTTGYKFKSILMGGTLCLLVACGGGEDVTPSTGAGGSVTCTGAQIAGQWRVTLKVLGNTQSETYTLDESDVDASTGTLNFSQDGVDLTGSFDASCTSASGSVSQGFLRGSWTAVKL